MPVTVRRVARPISPVFELLEDASAYPCWLLGAKATLPDNRWPMPGGRFRHRVGVGMLTLSDVTEVIGRQFPTRLQLRVRARPAIVAEVVFDLAADGDGTLVRMEERVVGRYRLASLVLHPLIKARNELSMDRFVELFGDPELARLDEDEPSRPRR